MNARQSVEDKIERFLQDLSSAVKEVAELGDSEPGKPKSHFQSLKLPAAAVVATAVSADALSAEPARGRHKCAESHVGYWKSLSSKVSSLASQWVEFRREAQQHSLKSILKSCEDDDGGSALSVARTDPNTKYSNISVSEADGGHNARSPISGSAMVLQREALQIRDSAQRVIERCHSVMLDTAQANAAKTELFGMLHDLVRAADSFSITSSSMAPLENEMESTVTASGIDEIVVQVMCCLRSYWYCESEFAQLISYLVR